MNTVKERAFAKINLYLDVVGRRSDGFHDIRSVMHAVSLADTLTVSEKPARAPLVYLTVNGNSHIPTDHQNLAVRAALAYLNYTGLSREIHITLDKKIPVGAGLAGGSSDAAAVLRAMNRLFSRMLSERILLDLAASLGSDVPFCLLGGTAFCEGRGEKMTRLCLSRRLYFVIGTSFEHVSTPTAYGALDERYSSFDGSVPFGDPTPYGNLTSYLNGESALPTLYNIFEDVILPRSPRAAEIREHLCSLGAAGVLMSGSGPSVYGIFDSAAAAHAACDALLAHGYRAFFAESI